MEEDELTDLFGGLLRELQCLEPLARHPRADDLVVVEGHRTGVGEGTRGGLAAVVHECGPAQHQPSVVQRLGVLSLLGITGQPPLQLRDIAQHLQGVGVDVLVLPVLVLGQLQGRQFGQDVRGDTGGDHEVQAGPRLSTEHELVEFGGDALSGDPVDLGGHPRHGVLHPGCDLEAELGGETAGAEHAQRVVVEGLLGGGRRVEHTVDQVLETVQRVPQLVRTVGRQLQGDGVAAEVPAHQVLVQRGAVGDLRITRGAVVLVSPEGGDLHGHPVDETGDGAEGDAGVPDGGRHLVEDPGHHLRTCVGGEVEVMGEASEESVPDGTADEEQGMSTGGEGAGEGGECPVVDFHGVLRGREHGSGISLHSHNGTAGSPFHSRRHYAGQP